MVRTKNVSPFSGASWIQSNASCGRIPTRWAWGLTPSETCALLPYLKNQMLSQALCHVNCTATIWGRQPDINMPHSKQGNKLWERSGTFPRLWGRVMDVGLDPRPFDILPRTSLLHRPSLHRRIPTSAWYRLKSFALHIAEEYNQLTTHTGLEESALMLPYVFKKNMQNFLISQNTSSVTGKRNVLSTWERIKMNWEALTVRYRNVIEDGLLLYYFISISSTLLKKAFLSPLLLQSGF